MVIEQVVADGYAGFCFKDGTFRTKFNMGQHNYLRHGF
jgi:hypothetical protein